jgi:molybdenum cofactor cytidylyltransferase
LEQSIAKNPLNIGLVILAAGNSSRLGYPKQLIDYNGKPLIINAVNSASEIDFLEKIVVLGANCSLIIDQIDKLSLDLLDFKIGICENWESGINESIKFGADYLISHHSEIEAILFMVCDQIYLSGETVKSLIDDFNQDNSRIVCSKYDTGYGIPAIFPKKYFTEILSLPAQIGCKSIINKNINNVVFIDFPKGNIDIDTAEDIENYIKLS